MKNAFVALHGHFYQPPRENPWLEVIETEESAHPFHDWNERIAVECYRPNAHARILDGKDKILKIIDQLQFRPHALCLAGKAFSFGLSEDPGCGPGKFEAVWPWERDRTSLQPHHHAFGQ
jgi:hypothetical protein